MKTTIQIAKIRAVILYIMQSFPHGVDYIKLFKILYFAQQDHLVKYGKVIVEDSFRGLKFGLVPAYTYKALQIAEGKPLDGNFDAFLSSIKVHDKKVYTSVVPDMDYISGANKRCLDSAIAKYKDTDPHDLSDWSHDSAWKEAMTRIQDDPQKNFITIIDIARAGKATEDMVDYIREKQRYQERFILNQMDDKIGALEKQKTVIVKAEQIDMSSVKIGDIIYVSLDEEDGLILKDRYKDRNKYIVIIGFTPEGVAVGSLLINSGIDSLKRSEELLNCQYPLMVRNYRNILDYDSWLDCSDIFELKITEKNIKLKGCLISEDRELVMQFLRETEVFDNTTKRRYGIISVIPMVKVNRNGNIVEEDSKLYMDLLDRARKLYSSYKEEDIRKEATFVYDKFKTIEFKRQYGDWELYKSVVNKTMTDEDINAYSSKYNNNFDALKDDIIIELNDQMEPNIESFLSISGDSSVFTDSIESYPFISDSKQAYINRVLASIVIRLEDNLKDLKVKDFRHGYHVRGLVADVLERYAIGIDSSNFKSVKTMKREYLMYLKEIGSTKEEALKNLIVNTYSKWEVNLLALAKDLRNNDDKHIWSSFINYFRATFYANISDFDTEDSMTMDELNGNAVAYEENNINKEYNSARQYKVNRKDTVSTRFKIFITKMLYNNESRIFADPNDVTNNDVNGTRSYFNDYGLVMPFDINILWNDLIQASYDVTNKTELIHNQYFGKFLPRN